MTRDQDACGLIQFRHTVPGAILYQPLLVPQRRQPDDDREPARHRASGGALAGLTPGDLVVDIGCNDGTLLDGYDRRAAATSASTPPMSRATRSRRATTSSATSSRHGRCARATRTAGEGHDEHRDVLRPRGPARFVADMAARLADDGVWVMELHYLPTMLEMNAFDTIVHEHLEYYSLAVHRAAVAEAGLEIVRRRAQRRQRRLDPPVHRLRGQAAVDARVRPPPAGAADPRVRARARRRPVRRFREAPSVSATTARRLPLPAAEGKRSTSMAPDEGQHDPPVHRRHRADRISVISNPTSGVAVGGLPRSASVEASMY